MADPKKPLTPRVNKLIELEATGRIKPEHQQELDVYRAQGVAPKKAGAGTEGERKASAFLSRALGSNKAYEATGVGPRSLVGQAVADTYPNVLNTLPSAVGNSPDRQVSDSAQDEFIAASLRQDSGAAIPPEELERQRRIYFPMPGDGEEAIKQKRMARLRAIDGLVQSAGTGLTAEQKEALAAIQDDLKAAVTGSAPAGAVEGETPDGQPPREETDTSGAITRVIDEAAGVYDDPNRTPDGRLRVTIQPDRITPSRRMSTDRGENGFVENADAFIRGAADTATLGFADEIAAAGQTIFGDGTMADNLRAQRNVDRYDERENPVFRGVGQLAGAVAPVGAGRIGLGSRGARDLAITGGVVGGLYGVGSGETMGERFTGAAGGAAAGAAGGLVLGKLSDLYMARRASRAQASSNREAAAVAADRFSVREAAERQGVELLPADVGGPIVGRMTAGTAQSPYGVNRIVEGSKRSVDSLQSARDRVAGDAPIERAVGESVQAAEQKALDRASNAVRDSRDAVTRELGAPQDATGAGQIAQRGANRFIEETSDRASRLYERIPIEQSVAADLSATRETLAGITARMESNPELGAMFRNPRMEAYLRALTPTKRRELLTNREIVEGGSLSWQDLKDFRSIVGDMLDSPSLSEDIAPRQLRALYASLSKDMQATARKRGPDAYRAWKRANDYYDGRQKRIEGPLSLLLGNRKDATANEAYSQVERLARDAAGGDFAQLGQILRSLPPEDAAALRATIVSRAGESSGTFDAKAFSKAWGGISDRAKSYILPQPGMRELMNEAASRAADIEAKGALAGKSGEAVFESLERMAKNKGDSRRFREMVNNLSPDEASDLRGRLIKRMGHDTAGRQNEAGDAFSPSRFMTQWSELSDDAKMTLFGNGELRSAMDDLVKVAARMKEAQKYANTSGSAGAISVDKTNTGLAGAVLALLTGHPVIAAGLAAPAGIQNVSARMLTSPRMVRWLARAPKLETRKDETAHIRRLSAIATRDPTIRNEVLALQSRLASSFTEPLRSAATEDDPR